ncbi:hypothetical protein MLD38_015618 [Melastoma candidum]|uniref:Uncharacterized protein n=1 Tax=Melastoma candidum TaxID=119954 RepID=A0ACB9RHV6_9MYRT|nr:hypothetical protein MLD38_015618 [Melastoma candidum]
MMMMMMIKESSSSFTFPPTLDPHIANLGTTTPIPPLRIVLRASVTFLPGNGDYVKGVVGLAKGLRKCRSRYPSLSAVLPDVPLEHHPVCHVINYSKLRIWEIVGYGKMIYLNHDIQVFENIDHLFDRTDGYFYAVMDCYCKKTWSHALQYQIAYCQKCPEKVQWDPKLGPRPAFYFNAGIFIYKPSHHELLRTVEALPIPS